MNPVWPWVDWRVCTPIGSFMDNELLENLSFFNKEV